MIGTVRRPMSDLPPKADITAGMSESPLCATTGHGPLLVSEEGRRPSNLGVLGFRRLLATDPSSSPSLLHRRNFSGRILMRMLSRRCLLLSALIAPWVAHA